jgi:Family of unknown function (DUF5989)
VIVSPDEAALPLCCDVRVPQMGQERIMQDTHNDHKAAFESAAKEKADLAPKGFVFFLRENKKWWLPPILILLLLLALLTFFAGSGQAPVVYYGPF